MGFWTFILLLFAVIIAIRMIQSPRTGSGGSTGVKVCGTCGAQHPQFATFCRQCGNKLS